MEKQLIEAKIFAENVTEIAEDAKSKAESDIQIAHFFFQAEDGIRYKLVTGVQTCALPILLQRDPEEVVRLGIGRVPPKCLPQPIDRALKILLADVGVTEVEEDVGIAGIRIGGPREEIRRSEERRVGKECRARWTADHEQAK